MWNLEQLNKANPYGLMPLAGRKAHFLKALYIYTIAFILRSSYGDCVCLLAPSGALYVIMHHYYYRVSLKKGSFSSLAPLEAPRRSIGMEISPKHCQILPIGWMFYLCTQLPIFIPFVDNFPQIMDHLRKQIQNEPKAPKLPSAKVLYCK